MAEELDAHESLGTQYHDIASNPKDLNIDWTFTQFHSARNREYFCARFLSNDRETEWVLKICRRGEPKNRQFSVKLCVLNVPFILHAQYKCLLMTQGGFRLFEYPLNNLSFKQNRWHLIFRSEMEPDFPRPIQELRILISIALRPTTVHKLQIYSQTPRLQQPSLRAYSCDGCYQNHYYHMKINYDLHLHAQNKVFKAHEDILKSSSVFFSEVRKSYMKDRPMRFRFTQYNSNAVREVLNFMNKREFDKFKRFNVHFLKELLNIALYLGVEELKSIITDHLIGKIDTDSLVIFLDAANKFELTKLKDRCILFTGEHKDKITQELMIEQMLRLRSIQPVNVEVTLDDPLPEITLF